MFAKNLEYFRLKRHLTKKELAQQVGVSNTMITYYESGKKMPELHTAKKLADCLGIQLQDLMQHHNDNVNIVHGDYRKLQSLSKSDQSFVQKTVERYLNKLNFISSLLGPGALPEWPDPESLDLGEDVQSNAAKLRNLLGFPSDGPVPNLIQVLENHGIPVFLLDVETDRFSGLNGTANQRPYVAVNRSMTAERIRSTIAHELAHIFFKWPADMEQNSIENLADAIGGVFLISDEDMVRELGVKRKRVTSDFLNIAREYGISSYLLVKRATQLEIVTDQSAKSFYIQAAKNGWKKNEPQRIVKEEPTLFPQLVYRAVTEQEISVERGAEILETSYEMVLEQTFPLEGRRNEITHQ